MKYTLPNIQLIEKYTNIYKEAEKDNIEKSTLLEVIDNIE